MEDDIEEGTVHVQPVVVMNEAQLAEPIHEEADAGARGADHLGERFLADLRAEAAPDNALPRFVSVLDGDTIEVLHNRRAERIRLSGIDCPEKGQAYGKRAKQAASELFFGKEVTLQTHGKDKYGRTLANVR